MAGFSNPEDNFGGLKDFDFAPHWHAWEGLGFITLRDHGVGRSCCCSTACPPGATSTAMSFRPSWRQTRCIAPDHLGFGKSDKPGDLSWYSLRGTRRC